MSTASAAAPASATPVTATSNVKTTVEAPKANNTAVEAKERHQDSEKKDASPTKPEQPGNYYFVKYTFICQFTACFFNLFNFEIQFNSLLLFV